MKRADILAQLHAHQRELDAYGVKSLALFGSVARDEARPDSDIDLLVEFSRPVGLFTFIALQQYLERLLNCKVDLGTAKSLRPGLRARVLREAVHVD
jgi:predicted nucleotidyltransferase